MVEAEAQEKCLEYAQKVIDAIRKGGHTLE
jgi:hypothetical protein